MKMKPTSTKTSQAPKGKPNPSKESAKDYMDRKNKELDNGRRAGRGNS